jgi:hypothetical protein
VTTLREKIAQKLQNLPETSLREVLDFVEFLSWKGVNQGQDDPVLSVAGTLSGKTLSSEEIEQELYPYWDGLHKGSIAKET